ncbi:MAG: GAF domain-containing protein, partial [Sphingomicrobium sp.]
MGAQPLERTAVESGPSNDADRGSESAVSNRADVVAAHGPDTLLDDPELKELVEFAGILCDTPISLVSLVEEHRQRFLARRGLDAQETPRSASFCQYAMLSDEIYEVVDARLDPWFANNALVTGAPFVRFYAGAPLVADDGTPLGSLCVISPDARPGGLTSIQRQGLRVMARAAMRRINDRRIALAGEKTKEALDDSRAQFDALADAIPQMAWSTDAAGQCDYFNARWADFTGKSIDDHLGDGWIEALHPEDIEMAVAA